jgi:protein required for attachment to host cells
MRAELDHPGSRERSRDLVADAYGCKPVGGSRAVPGPSGPGTRPGGFHGRPGAEPDTDPKEVEAEKFARTLADALEKGLDAHSYDALVITAPPHFLGLVKETISDKVRKRLAHTIDKDFSLLSARDIEQRVRARRAA